MASNKIKIESFIVQRLLGEHDQTSGLIIFKNEIWKAYKLSKDITEILTNYKSDKKIGKQEIADKLQEINQTKISSDYFEFLLEIVQNYFEVETPMLSNYFHPKFGI